MQTSNMNIEITRPRKKCGVCEISGELFRCSRCKVAFYCSKEHQRKDWEKHRSKCKPCKESKDESATSLDSLAAALPTISASELYTTVVEKPSPSEVNTMPVSGAESNFRRRMQAKDFPQITFNQHSSKYFERQLPFDLEEIVSNVIQDMNEYGLCVVDNFMGEERGNQIHEEVLKMHTKGIFRNGQLVSNKGDDTKTIRGDQITWIDGREEGCSHIAYMIGQVDSVLMKANKMRNNGKLGQYNINGRTMAMVACYPGHGSHYVKHVDNPNQDGRCITAIYYLNKDWNVSKCGGLLRIFPDGCTGLDDKVADIEPIFDRLLFFWSDRRNPHEVQPAFNTRYAITLWYFDSKEREEACRKYQPKPYNL